MASTIYRKLPHATRSIRLLVLQPAKDSTQSLKAELKTVSLDSSPEYDALSYVWGGPDKPSRIELSFENSQTEVPITKNLQLALTRLRDRDRVLVTWVDALCINQGDVTERNSQVSLMGSIYSNATLVTAFIHEGAHDHSTVSHTIDFIQALSVDPAHHIVSPLELQTGNSVPESATIGFGGLLMFFKAQWWQRVWTVQEAILASDLRIIYGSREVDFKDLLLFCNAFHYHLHYCCHEFNPAPNLLLVPSIERLTSTARDLARYQVSHGLSSGDFLDVLGTFRYRNATDLRDKLYGLSALSKLPTEIVDYSLSVPMVYTCHTVTAMQDSKNLDIWSYLLTMNLRHGSPFSQPTNDGLVDLPSWVPDWSLKFHADAAYILKHRHRYIQAFSACSETEICMRYSSPDNLRLKGVRFDKVEKVGVPNLQPNLFQASLIPEWERVACINESNTLEAIHIKYSGLYRAFRRAMTWDLGFNEPLLYSSPDSPEGQLNEPHSSDIRRANDSRDRFLYEFCRHDEPSIELKDYEANEALVESITPLEIERYRGLVMTMTLGKRFLVTESGRLGFGPAETEVGDEVFCFYGGKTSYIVRSLPMTMSRILGDAYIEGAMDGLVIQLAEDDSSPLMASEYVFQ